MELAGWISLVVMPWVIKVSTGYIKEIKPIPMVAHRVLIIRAIVAVLALIGAMLTVTVGDSSAVEPALVEVAGIAVFNAITASWLYLREK